VCYRLFVCDSRSSSWDIGRVLLRMYFYRLPFTPPTLVANPVLQKASYSWPPAQILPIIPNKGIEKLVSGHLL
jgi:hypothetical protein